MSLPQLVVSSPPATGLLAAGIAIATVLLLVLTPVTAPARRARSARKARARMLAPAHAMALERVGDAVIVIDSEGTMLELNEAALRILRVIRPEPAADPVGRSFFRILGTARPMQGPPMDAEYVLPVAGGELRLRLRTSGLTDRRGRPIGFVIVVQDLTEAAERGRELAELNTRLREQAAVIERLRAEPARQAVPVERPPGGEPGGAHAAAGRSGRDGPRSSEPTVRDVLTGLHSRGHLLATLDRGLAEAAAHGGRLSVVLLDIDRFETVNDRFGHAVGDQVLAATAQALKQDARSGDTVARYGGEEFVVLLPEATLEVARERAEQWRRRCATASVAASGGRVCVTFSAGVAMFPECGRSAEELLRAAGEALYEAKAAGRDRVVPAEPT